VLIASVVRPVPPLGAQRRRCARRPLDGAGRSRRHALPGQHLVQRHHSSSALQRLGDKAAAPASTAWRAWPRPSSPDQGQDRGTRQPGRQLADQRHGVGPGQLVVDQDDVGHHVLGPGRARSGCETQ
jgi:hypothetical protein